MSGTEEFDWGSLFDIAYFLEHYYYESIFTALALAAAILFGPFLYFLAREVMKPKAFLDATKFKPLTLVEREELNHNSRRYRFALPEDKMRLGLPIGQHIQFKYEDAEGRDVLRSYTPTTDDDTLGYVDFVIKVYPKGKMSKYVDELKIGDTLDVKGPKGEFKSYIPNCRRAFGMVAGGTGITPMYQVAKAILKNPADKTQMHLIFANVTEDDILLRDEWDAMAKEHPDQLKVHYVLNEAPEGWTGSTGFVTEEIIREHCPAPADDVTVLMCGPYLMNKAVKGHLASIGHAAKNMFAF